MEKLELNLTLTVQQVNVILKYLGGGAYIEVADIVAQIREQAALQLAPAGQPLAASEELQDAA